MGQRLRAMRPGDTPGPRNGDTPAATGMSPMPGDVPNIYMGEINHAV